MPSVRSPTAVGLAVAGLVLLVYAFITGGAVIAFAVEAFGVTCCLLAPYAKGRDDPWDDDGDDPPEFGDDPGPPAPGARSGVGGSTPG